MTGHIPPGQRECSHCSGYGSSLREEQEWFNRVVASESDVVWVVSIFLIGPD